MQFGTSPEEVAFWGVPFAAPPVEELRWRPPEPAKKWEGTRKAAAFGPVCPQLPQQWLPYIAGQEDCLYLNIWTTHLSENAKLPVIVYFHGGGGLELSFLCNMFREGWEQSAADAKLREAMRVYWTQFAKTGDPNRGGFPVWPAFDPTISQSFELGHEIWPRALEPGLRVMQRLMQLTIREGLGNWRVSSGFNAAGPRDKPAATFPGMVSGA
jgi:carboxylesterase type B